MIISRLVYDVRGLHTCSLTCYSWCFAAIPHVHNTFTVGVDYSGRELWPPIPLRHMFTLGLLPLVEEFSVRGDDGSDVFSSNQFNRRILRYCPMLIDVQRLSTDFLDIPNFMAKSRLRFGRSMPAARDLFLMEPKGSPRQIIYIIGLFEHLEDFRLRPRTPDFWRNQRATSRSYHHSSLHCGDV